MIVRLLIFIVFNTNYCVSLTTTSSPVWDFPCHYHNVLTSHFERSPNYTLQLGDMWYCDGNGYYGPSSGGKYLDYEGWYRFTNGEDLLTRPPESGQCGSMTPIWLDGELPTEYAETVNLTACMVVNDTNCAMNWTVPVIHCEDYNVAYLTPYSFDLGYGAAGCGVYCMELAIDPCDNYTTINYENSRHIDFDHSVGHSCEESQFLNGWFFFDGGYDIANHPVGPGQCGSSYPIWFKGSLPSNDGDISHVKACAAGDNQPCLSYWTVPVKKCGANNIVYFKSETYSMYCGRYCIEAKNASWTPSWDTPCYNHYTIDSTLDRSNAYTLQDGEHQSCDVTYYDWYGGYYFGSLMSGEIWYKFSGNENIPTVAPTQGRCGSMYPIWFEGNYPTNYAEMTSLKACIVGNHSDCDFSWDTFAINCGAYNVFQLKTDYLAWCSKYCIDQVVDPCTNYTSVEYDESRHADNNTRHYSNMMSSCDSTSLSRGWYRLEGGYRLASTPLGPNHCGSDSPVWIKGSLPSVDGVIEYVTACEATGTSPCTYSWILPVMKCGSFDIMYHRYNGMCGRYCLEPKESSFTQTWDSPCHYMNRHTITSSYERTSDYMVQSDDYYMCDGMDSYHAMSHPNFYNDGWYRFSNGEDFVRKPVQAGGCGSWYPIWFNGSYPNFYGEMTTVEACMASNDSNCDRSWDVYVMKCNDSNIAFLEPNKGSENCGRYCMELEQHPCDNYSTISYDDSFHADYYNPNSMTTCLSSVWSTGWYRIEGDYRLTTTPVGPGHCGSYRPVWIKGSLPEVDRETSYVKACQSSSYSPCSSSWTVPMMKCGSFDIMYLRRDDMSMCIKRYCLEAQNDTWTMQWDSPCYSPSIMPGNVERWVNYQLQPGESESCDNYYGYYYSGMQGITSTDWYRFGNNENIPTTAPEQLSCGSRNPVWLEGTYPTEYAEMAVMKACKVGNDSNCEQSWDVYVMRCHGYNSFYLTPIYYGCGKYCAEPQVDPCNNYTSIPYDESRHSDYSHTTTTHNCESTSFYQRWYRFEGDFELATSPTVYGHCGAYSTVWVNGTFPEMEGTISNVRACEMDSMSSDWCSYNWDIPVMKCPSYNIYYLQSSGMCGRYCLEPGNIPWDVPCHQHRVVQSDFERSVNYTYQEGDAQYCDRYWTYDSFGIYHDGWARFSEGEDIPTSPPKPGQCGTQSPIWLDGQYPTQYGEIANLTACMVVNDTDCYHNWNVTVMHCTDFNVAELKSLDYNKECGRYCTEPAVDPCSNYTLLDYDHTRHMDYYHPMGMNYNCESSSLGYGWYRMEGDYRPAMTPVGEGQCGSSEPIWMKGHLPETDREISYMTACQGSNLSPCVYNWTVPVMKCGSFDIMYLKPKGMCGRYCLEALNTTWDRFWDSPCYSYNTLNSEFDRLVNYTMRPEEQERCDGYHGYYSSMNYIDMEQWYRFSNNENIPTWPSEQRMCRTWYPIWAQGTYPTEYGETAVMKACKVGNDSNCEQSWDIYVMHCHGYNTFYLKSPFEGCGRYCTEFQEDPCYNYTSIEYDKSRHSDYNHTVTTSNCESTNMKSGWYRFEGEYKLATKPTDYEQCGSYSTVWINDTYPTTMGQLHHVKACEADSMHYGTYCTYSWDIPVMTCPDYHVFYLQSSGMCGRYCLEEGNIPWDVPCHHHHILKGGFERSINYTLQNSDMEQCDRQWNMNYLYNSMSSDNWFRFSDGEILTSPPEPRQCGSWRPIWLDGQYPTEYAEKYNLTACMVGNDTNCNETWSVPVMNCGDYNVAQLRFLDYYEPCGKYCTKPAEDPCDNYTLIEYDHTRHMDFYNYMGGYGCESYSYSDGWYRFEGDYQPAMTPVGNGQCGTSEPIWMKGHLPGIDQEITYMKACQGGSSNPCSYSWTVPVKKCGSFNIMHLKPQGMCGRYCQEALNTTWERSWTTPCWSYSTLNSNINRLVNNRLQQGDNGKCDGYYNYNGYMVEIDMTQWYRFGSHENLLTSTPDQGQCGSWYPIWAQGTYPTEYGETAVMKACKVGNDSNCEQSWDIYVMNCHGYNAFYLNSYFSGCGRYCTEPQADPCNNYTSIEYDKSRHSDYAHTITSHHCESTNFSPGWYKFEGNYSLATSPTGTGTCGSYNTVWINDTLPTVDQEIKYVKACESDSMYSYTHCYYTWDIPTMKCGDYSIYYLQSSGNCGRYCLEPGDIPWDVPCHNYRVVSSQFERSVNYTRQDGDRQYCDNQNHIDNHDIYYEDWYRFNGGEDIPTRPVKSGDCGTMSPIWLDDGVYPTQYAELSNLTACMVVNDSDCYHSWNVSVMNCGDFNVAHLKPVPYQYDCGRYCIEQDIDPCSNFTIIDYDESRHADNVTDYMYMYSCDWLNDGWYKFEGDYKPQNKPLGPNHCGYYNPIWMKGNFPTKENTIDYMFACEVSGSNPCQYNWSVPVMKCGDFDIFYLKQRGMCGRYCLEPKEPVWTQTWDTPCYDYRYSDNMYSDYRKIPSSFERSSKYTLQYDDWFYCDSNHGYSSSDTVSTQGWYRFSNGENFLTESVEPGDCGSWYPIWFNGTYPSSYGEMNLMQACMNTNTSECEHSWDVYVMKCNETNVAYLTPDINECGRYCMELAVDPCDNYTVIPYDNTTHADNYDPYSPDYCHSYRPKGWYGMEGDYKLATTPVGPGQCGSSSPFWLKGGLPTIDGEISYLRACHSSDSSPCSWSYSVPVMKCGSEEIMYLRNDDMCEKTYCLESRNTTNSSSWDYPCHNHHVVPSSFERTVDHILQPGEYESCDNEYWYHYGYYGYSNGEISSDNWYRFENYENVLNRPPEQLSCGSLYPIWFDGTYPTEYAEMSHMRVCKVGNDSDCEHKWDTYVMHCDGFNVAHLTPYFQGCGKYCTEPQEDPCNNYTMIEYDSTRHMDYYNYWGGSNCDYYSKGWYRFDGDYGPAMSPVGYGQCGSSKPIWMKGSLPVTDGEISYVKACKGSDSGSPCSSSWTVPVKKCGSYNIMYINNNGMCGRYCTEAQNTTWERSWTTPCHSYNYISSSINRLVNYTLQPGEQEYCDSYHGYYMGMNDIDMEQWYRFGTSENLLTWSPSQLQCGSRSPIWVDGTYPTEYGETAVMKACKVGNDSNCEQSWDVYVMHCHGYNSFYLTPYFSGCGRYCTEAQADPCNNYTSIEYDKSRHSDYSYSITSHSCESMSFSSRWYRFEGNYSLATSPTGSGRCGSHSPVWINDTLPTVDGEVKYVKACEASDMYSYMDCYNTWDIPTMKCGDYHIYHLQSSGSCGRYCLEEGNIPWDVPCHHHHILKGGFERSVNYTLQNGDMEQCDRQWNMNYLYSSMYSDNWFRFSDGDILTSPPEPRQCGSWRPIWLDGQYPSEYAETYNLTACMVGNDTNCNETWSVPVMNCGDYNVAQLRFPSYYEPCGKYCTELAQDPCDNYTLIEYDHTRHMDFYNYMGGYGCESYSYSDGWYRFEGDYQPAMTPVGNGQCGTSEPIWMKGQQPEMDQEITYMKACQGGNTNPCSYSWTVPVKKCGSFNILHLKPQGMCGRYCLEALNTTWERSWIRPCWSYSSLNSNINRLVNNRLQPGDNGKCDGYYSYNMDGIHMTEWYRFGSQENLLTSTPDQGQCGTWYPIWAEGTFPTEYGETSVMKACKVGNDSNCGQSWDVYVMHCHGYNSFYLTPYFSGCGRYCTEAQADPCNNYTSIEYDKSRHSDYSYSITSHSCESTSYSKGWYRFEGNYSLATSPTGTGRCGSQRPVWINDTLPTVDGELKYVKACEASDMYSDIHCSYTWDIPTMKCGDYHIYHLQSSGSCGRYCLEEGNIPWDVPCHHHNILKGGFERSVNYTLQSGDIEQCDRQWDISYLHHSMYSDNWFRFSDGEILTSPPEPRQCGSWRPIWLDGQYPSEYAETYNLTACMVGNDTNCNETWSVPVMNCGDYNVAQLRFPSYYEPCGKYCTELAQDPCDNYTLIEYDHTRHMDFYNYMGGYGCESYSYSDGWYRFEGDYQPAMTPVGNGQCGTSEPIWMKGQQPENDQETTYMKACQGGSTNPCSYSWTVPVKKCGSFNIMHLKPQGMCGRYCLEALNTTWERSWTQPCWSYSSINSNINRLVNNRLQPGDNGKCDGYYNYHMDGIHMTEWYRFGSHENLLTSTPDQGQCGSWYPIWAEGTYPTEYGETAVMKACKMGNDSNCEQSWDVYVMHCHGYNAFYLNSNINGCGRYCTEPQADPCYNYTSIEYDKSRHSDYSHTTTTHHCESTSFSPGWYKFEGNYSLATSPTSTGTCGSYSTVWINDTFPTVEGELKYVKACESDSMYSDMYCSYTWDIPTMKCGDYSIYYLQSSGNCGRYCLESGDIPWDVPCHNHRVVSSQFERSVNYTRQDGDRQNCDNQWHIDNYDISYEDWYRFNGGEDIPTWPVKSGDCGTTSPIWLDGGIYPTQYGELSNLTACMVVNDSDCYHSWNVSVMNCGDFNVAHLKPVPYEYDCGRYCIEQDIDPCSNFTIIDYDESRHADNVTDYMYMSSCDWLNEGWYSFEGDYGLYNKPVGPYHCGYSTPIWMKGSFPTKDKKIGYMTACEISGYDPCQYSWSVPVMKCGAFNIFYLRPRGMCGRYCLEPKDPVWTQTWDRPCNDMDHYHIDGNFGRSPDSILQPGIYPDQYSTCDDFMTMMYSTGWYGFSHDENFVTKPVQARQCRSWNPIWFNGTSPTSYGEMTTMKACMAGNDSSCESSWDVYVMKCNDSSVAYLPNNMNECGRYCMELSIDPCDNYTVMSYDNTTHADYYDPYSTSECLYSYSEGWFRMEGDYNLATTPVVPGQCGSSRPVWVKGTMPDTEGEITYLEACVANHDSSCSRSSSVPVKKCNGYDIYYLRQDPLYLCLLRHCLENETVIETESLSSTMSLMSTLAYTSSQPAIETTSIDNFSYSVESMSSSIFNNWTMISKSALTSSSDWIMTSSSASISSSEWTMTTNSESVSSSDWTMPSSSASILSSDWGMTLNSVSVSSSDWTMPSSSASFSSSDWTISSSSESVSSSDWTMPSSSASVYSSDWTIPSSSASVSSSDIMTSSSMSVSNSDWTIQSSSARTLSSDSTKTTGSASISSSDWTMTSSSSSDWTIPSSSATTLSSDWIMTSSSVSTSSNDWTLTSSSGLISSSDWTLTSSSVSVSSSFSSSNYYSSSNDLTMTSSSPSVSNSVLTMTSSSPSVSSSELTMTSSSTSLSSSDLTMTSSSPSVSSSELTMTSSSPSVSSSDLTVTSSSQSVSSSDLTMTSTSPSVSSSYLTMTSSSQSVSSSISPTSSSQYGVVSSTVGEIQTTTSSPSVDDINLADYISYIYARPLIPTYDLSSPDHQLMFECRYYRRWYWYSYMDDSLLYQFTYDVLWQIDNEDFLIKENVQLDDIKTNGRIKSTDWKDRERKMGINFKCGLRLHGASNTSFVMASWSYFAGLDMWPRTIDVSSGDSVNVYVWNTVPVACKYNDTNYECKITLDLFDFNEQFTSGSPMYCNGSVTQMTKPSMCGLELDAWRQWSWQKLTVNLPENTASDQEYQARVKLRVINADDDDIWANYQLREIIVNVVNENVTDDYWWWYGWCFTGTDPWFGTFDWRWYGFHDQGEFVLYRHKTKPIEVHTIMRKYEPHHIWTEHCAIAVRAASDVFIIYGCSKPAKWKIRRFGCDSGSEYLEVYSRWGGYEVVLPTGTRVYIWIALNRRINAYITASRTDRYNVEGLCGTWNRDYEDDYTGRDGKVYQNSTLFARTWSVPANDSLFIEKKRTEKLSQSVMYCSCMNSTDPGLSPNVDCSWKETMPVCPPLNWAKESCSIRGKRSADGTAEDDNPIDAPPELCESQEEPEVDTSWKNGWNETSADKACNDYFHQQWELFSACSELSNVDANSSITNCILNIQVSGTDEDMADAFQMFKTQCENEVRTNNSLWTNNNSSSNGSSNSTDSAGSSTFSIGALVSKTVSCPDCKNGGQCSEGECNCVGTYTGPDCSQNREVPPDIATELSEDSKCDISLTGCNNHYIYGENIIQELCQCKVEEAQFVGDQIIRTGGSEMTTCTARFGGASCGLASGRRKRSTSDRTSNSVLLVSVSNNGQNFSSSVPIVMYDSSCTVCETNDTSINCQLRTDICVINGLCYSENSTQCATTPATSSDEGFKMWIIGVITAGLLLIIIVILLVKCCFKKSHARVPVAPYDEPIIEASSHTQITGLVGSSMEKKRKIQSPSKINVQPANW